MAKTAAERQSEYRERVKAERSRLTIVISRFARDSLKALQERNPTLTQAEILEELLITAAPMSLEEMIERRLLALDYYNQLKKDDPEAWRKASRTAMNVLRSAESYFSMRDLSALLDRHISNMAKKRSR